MKLRALALGIAVWLAGSAVSASGFVGLYAIVDKVVFEPNEQAPERIQVWGSFMFLDQAIPPGRQVAGRPRTGPPTTAAKRGYVYFRLPIVPPSGGQDVIKKEWADLKSVAGTGEAVGFGYWNYQGQFDSLRSNMTFTTWNDPFALRVLLPTEAPSTPVAYMTNVGVVKLTEASHAAVFKELRDAK